MAEKRRLLMRMWEMGISAALAALLGAGCVSKSDVLTQQGELGAEDNPWPGCGPDISGSIARSKLGDHCDFGGWCSTATDLVCKPSENRICENGLIFGATVDTLDCPWNGSTADAGSAAAYTDCLTALEQGKTGDNCGWTGSCVIRSQDSCCVEVAVCCNSPTRGLRRLHVCAPGCENVAPVANLPVATGCPTEMPSDRANSGLGRPCEGDFVCIGTTSRVTWCDHGVVVGGQGETFMCYLN
jgi:hypothetical protein